MKKVLRTELFGVLWVATVCAGVLAAFTVANAQTVGVTTQMQSGASGAQVSTLQTFLAADTTVYPEGLVTGYYGALTVAAVQRYQCKNGIVCSGTAASTGYGNVGPATLAKIQMQEGGTGGINQPPVGFPTNGRDVSAPALSAPNVLTTSSSATIHWTTNEPAHSFVMYATVNPSSSFNSYASMPTVSDSTFDMSSDVTLTGLAPNTRYFYVLDSTDASGNLQYGIDNSFVTNQ